MDYSTVFPGIPSLRKEIWSWAITSERRTASSGGVGIYARGLFFALIAEDRLYFKVDETTRPEFEERGMEPFRPFGEQTAMGYYAVVPADVVEAVIHLETWMQKAIDVAAKARRGKTKRSK
jgi:DNA transformation protein